MTRKRVPARSSTRCPWPRYHAYNHEGGGNLYSDDSLPKGIAPDGRKVTARRPGGGTGGSQSRFAVWDAPFIAWLEGSNYQADYCTDFDVHEDPTLLADYNLLLSVGHDEYWSQEMRSNVEAFIGNGGNVAFFSGNICWWRIHFTDNNTAFTCDKSSSPPNDKWWKSNPENSLTGVSLRNAGWWPDPNGVRPLLGYTVQHAGHWAYYGTGLADGSVFGDADSLVGKECDGAAFEYNSQGYALPTGVDGTPASFFILGIATVEEPPWDLPTRESEITGPHVATMGLYTRKGIVFTAATLDWAKVVPINPTVEQITRNVLDRLQQKAVRIVGPSPIACGLRVAAEGHVAHFHVDVAGLPRLAPLSYTWTISSGGARVLNQSSLEATMPSPPVPVTVTVTITGRGCDAFGTLTFIPLTTAEYLSLQVYCHLRDLIESLIVVPSLEEGPIPPDPFQELIRDRRVIPLAPQRLGALQQATAELAELVKQLQRLGYGER